jgi:hypothetical protein
MTAERLGEDSNDQLSKSSLNPVKYAGCVKIITGLLHTEDQVERDNTFFNHYIQTSEIEGTLDRRSRCLFCKTSSGHRIPRVHHNHHTSSVVRHATNQHITAKRRFLFQCTFIYFLDELECMLMLHLKLQDISKMYRYRLVD